MVFLTKVYDTDGTPWHAGDYPERNEGESFDGYTERLTRAVREAIVDASDSYDGACDTRIVDSKHEATVVLYHEDDEYTWTRYVRAVRPDPADAAVETDDGQYCVYWRSCDEHDGPRQRYATLGEAEACAARAQRGFEQYHPGGSSLCGFEVRDLFRLDVLSSEDAYGKWSIPHVSWDENYGRKTDDGKIALAGRFVIRQSASEPSKLLDKKAAAFMVEMHRNVIADGFVACIQSVYDARAKLAEDLDDHCAAKDLFLRDKLEHEKADVEEYKRATQEYEAGVADARSRYRNRISEIERGRDDRQRLAADAAERNYREQLHASGYDDDRIEKIISEWRKMTMVGSTSTGE